MQIFKSKKVRLERRLESSSRALSLETIIKNLNHFIVSMANIDLQVSWRKNRNAFHQGFLDYLSVPALNLWVQHLWLRTKRDRMKLPRKKIIFRVVKQHSHILIVGKMLLTCPVSKFKMK